METLICLASVLMLEARGEPQDGMLAVADVVMERVEHDSWPKTVCEVVKESDQFAAISTSDMQVLIGEDPEAWGKAVGVAADVLVDGERLNIGATHFHSGPDPWWTKDATFVGSYGGHKFWRLEK